MSKARARAAAGPLWKRGSLRVSDPNTDGSVTVYMSYTQTPIAVLCPAAGDLDERRELAYQMAAAPEALEELDRIVEMVGHLAAQEGGAVARWVMVELDGFRDARHILNKSRPPSAPHPHRRNGPNGPHGEPATIAGDRPAINMLTGRRLCGNEG